MRRIVLASASPRRRELLKQLGLQFEVEPTDYDEETTSASEPHETARELSLGKARTAAQKHRNALIIAADTFVVLGDRILGKPHTNEEAGEMLRALNG
jgi:septum formation protein